VGHHNQNFNGEKMLQHSYMKVVSAGREIPFLYLHGKFFTAFIKDGLLNPVLYITTKLIKIHCNMKFILSEIFGGK
jgi:hypothetical protein